MKFNKVIAFTTLLVLFISQSFAYAAMPCLHMSLGADMADMKGHSMSHEMPMQHMMHAEHDMADSGKNHASNMQTMDCCDDDCNCPPGACATYALSRLNLPDFHVSPAFFSSVYRFSMNESDPILLKRPPIAA